MIIDDLAQLCMAAALGSLTILLVLLTGVAIWAIIKCVIS